ncbi:MAG: hypothetical protein M4579_004185 [Chaenotheca gracillima]|nr:MAG: hypothetical protein M4579_004185 [Chaenotheca gracillima]
MEKQWTDGIASAKQHHPHHAQQGPPPAPHLQHPRPSSIVHQQQHHPNSPHQPSQPPPQGAPFNSPHLSSHQIQQPHQSQFPQGGQPPSGQHQQEIPYFAHQSPYNPPSASGAYSSAETPELMAAAHMNRPYPPIYHTPQSNSPASVASPSGHDQHGRSIYGQPPQMPQGMYGYPQSYPPMPPGGPSPYAHQPAPPQHSGLTSQALMMSNPPGHPQMHQAPPPHPQQNMNTSPRQKIAQQPLQRPPSGPMQPAGGHQPPPGPPATPGNIQQGAPGQGAAGVNPNAAPGPIPATTPLVVRQDNNGVQWIAFEYSRDRVKMEYTIRCDVESVNVETLSQEFKTENCVYPRACCNKDQYRGNRLVYETECNTVGWALAELNPCLRGKRGLIQRAVDSWRNSNQDPRLRSRRVRRMAKVHNRKAQATQQPNHMAGPSGPAPAGVPNPPAQPMPHGGGGMKPAGMAMGGPQLHHHHAHPDGNAPGGTDDVSAGGEYHNAPPQHLHPSQAPPGGPPGSANDVRPRQVFQGFAPNYPPHPNVSGAGMPPPAYGSMEHMGGPPASSNNPAVVASSGSGSVKSFDDPARPSSTETPRSKPRQFILMEDADRGPNRARVRVTLDQVEMKEIPDSYRKTYSVFPRSYFPMQMQSTSNAGRGDFPDDVDDDAAETITRTTIRVPMLDGSEAELPTPRMGKSRREKEVVLNDLGYRMSWSNRRLLAGRTIFLQKALDAYRNKTRSSMTKDGQDPDALAPHLETRVGRNRWMARNRQSRRQASSSS